MYNETLAKTFASLLLKRWRKKGRKTKATAKLFALYANTITKFSNAKISRMLQH